MLDDLIKTLLSTLKIIFTGAYVMVKKNTCDVHEVLVFSFVVDVLNAKLASVVGFWINHLAFATFAF